MSERDASPERAPQTPNPITRQQLYERVRALFLDFEQWANHILLFKILQLPDFIVLSTVVKEPEEAHRTYDYCIWKLTKNAWHGQHKLPRTKTPSAIFTFLCNNTSTKMGACFQLYYLYYATKIRGCTIDTHRFQAKLRPAWADNLINTGIARLLKHPTLIAKLRPEDRLRSQLLKLNALVIFWSEQAPSPSPYDAAKQAIRKDLKQTLATLPFREDAAKNIFAQLKVSIYSLYNREIYLSKYTFPEQFAFLLRELTGSIDFPELFHMLRAAYAKKLFKPDDFPRVREHFNKQSRKKQLRRFSLSSNFDEDLIGIVLDNAEIPNEMRISWNERSRVW